MINIYGERCEIKYIVDKTAFIDSSLIANWPFQTFWKKP